MLKGALGKLGFRILDFQMCMHGGSRDKRVRFWHSLKLNLGTLALGCDGSHSHKPWGKTKEGPGKLWATGEERCFPKLFCKRLAARAAKSLFVKPEEKALLENVDKVFSAAQPRKGLMELVPEFRVTEVIGRCSQEEVARLQAWQEAGRKTSLRWKVPISEGDKLLSVVLEKGSGGLSTILLGRAWTQLQFTAEAIKVMHPYDREIRVPPHVAEVIFNAATLGPAKLQTDRAKTLEYYEGRKKLLEAAEKTEHAKLNKQVEQVVKNKKILLFEEMLRDIGYDDMPVVNLLRKGIKIVDTLELVGIWKEEDKQAKCSRTVLIANAKAAQREAFSKTRVGEDSEALWTNTMEEAEGSGLLGPFTHEEMVEMLGEDYVPASRFAIRQGGKLRPVDDFSACLTNSAFGTREKVQMYGLDQVVAWARAWVDSVKRNRAVSILDSLGRKWEGTLHPGWSTKEWSDLVGRVEKINQYIHTCLLICAGMSIQECKMCRPAGSASRQREPRAPQMSAYVSVAPLQAMMPLPGCGQFQLGTVLKLEVVMPAAFMS